MREAPGGLGFREYDFGVSFLCNSYSSRAYLQRDRIVLPKIPNTIFNTIFGLRALGSTFGLVDQTSGDRC